MRVLCNGKTTLVPLAYSARGCSPGYGAMASRVQGFASYSKKKITNRSKRHTGTGNCPQRAHNALNAPHGEHILLHL